MTALPVDKLVKPASVAYTLATESIYPPVMAALPELKLSATKVVILPSVALTLATELI